MESKQRFPATSAALADDERFVHHLPLHRVFVSAFSMNFEAIHQLAAPDQRRVGIAATVLGALVSILGGLIGFLLADIVGFSTNLFFLVAGWGGIMVGIGAYRVGVSYFPALAGTTRAASVGRMLYVLAVFCVLGFGVLWALFRDA